MGGRLRLGWPDAAALALVGVWLFWVGVSGTLNGRPVPLGSSFLVAPLLVVAGAQMGRRAGSAARSDPAAEPGVGTWWTHVVLLCLVTALLPGVRLRLAPGPVPLGYLNANAAAAVQVLVLCGLALLDTTDRFRRAVLWVLAGAAGFAVVHHGSQAAMVVATPVAVAVVAMALRPARTRWWAVVLGVMTLVAGCVALLRIAVLSDWPDALQRALDPVRQELWAAALQLWRAHPLIGGGAGSYVEVNPYGADTDTMAAHSALLQVGSELGVIGVVLLALLVLVGFAWGVQSHAAHGVLLAAAWTALWLQALVDHLFDYPAVPLLAADVRAGRTQ